MNIKGDERSYEIKDANIDGEDGDDDGNREDVRFTGLWPFWVLDEGAIAFG